MDIAGGCYYPGRNLIGNIAKDVSDIKDATVSVAKIADVVGDYIVKRGVDDILKGLGKEEMALTIDEEGFDVEFVKKAKKYAINRNIEARDKKIMHWLILQNRRDL
jgi:hypothetical protein